MGALALGWLASACGEAPQDADGPSPATEERPEAQPSATLPRVDGPEEGTCTGTYPSYWQDPAFTATGMWHDEEITNQPPEGWSGPVFQLSDRFPTTPLGEAARPGPWQKHDPFKEGLRPEQKQAEAFAYIWAVMNYIQEGNVGAPSPEQDWDLCSNAVRPWFHMPFQTYDPLSGREFVHGLTREAPVTFTLKPSGTKLATTVWAVGFFNAPGGTLIGSVWKDGSAALPTSNLLFPEGTVIGKLLFTTATAAQLPFLSNVPVWQANISASDFCACTPAEGSTCTYREMSEQCPRSPGEVALLQFDVAVRDDRSPSGWAYGTFVADGQRKAEEPDPWLRISPLGLMWTNDGPPAGEGALQYPVDPRKNGFEDAVIFWDVVEMLEQASDAGHLGCNARLNGPADNPRSSCLSCHQTASVPDRSNTTPPIFDLGARGQCANPPSPDVDAVYFADQDCGSSFQGGSVVPPPDYASGATEWIGLDFSLQLSISLVQWQEWQRDRASQDRSFQGELPGR